LDFSIAAEQAVAVDRFAREIGAFLKSSHSARSRQLNGRRWATAHQCHGNQIIDVRSFAH
jgi:hypothetical protein